MFFWLLVQKMILQEHFSIWMMGWHQRITVLAIFADGFLLKIIP
jgi:hypothetical protein